MLNAFVDRIDRTGVNGWAVDSDDLSRRVPLRVLCNVNGFSEPVVAERLRPDLSGRPGMGDGRHGFALAFPPEVSAHQNLSIGIIEEASGKLLSGGYRNFPQLADSELVPIIVTAPARSGTTMLMNTLLQAPEICVAGNSPFEVMLSHYYAMAFNALTAGADPEGSTNRDDMNLERKWVGSNPFYDVGVWTRSSAREPLYRHFALEVPGTYLNTFRSAIADFYRADAGSKGKAKPNFFAEKNVWATRTVPRFVQMMFATTKELVLVRDPRDVVASQRSYFKTLRDSHVQEIIRYCAQYVDFTSRDPADTLVIKYENLVCDWSVQLQRISNFIGVEIPEERRELVDKTFAAHARSSSPESSIGRWRTELSKDDRTTIETLCGPFMERFSYL